MLTEVYIHRQYTCENCGTTLVYNRNPSTGKLWLEHAGFPDCLNHAKKFVVPTVKLKELPKEKK
jgi:hypothetical protein